MSTCVVIPALNPPESLIPYVRTLLGKGVNQVIVVNDGSKKEYLFVFKKLAALKGCVVLEHEQNKGKGRALKTAFQYFLQEHYHEIDGVVTADADGQHDIQDVLNIAEYLGDKEQIILGVRDFTEKNVPVRSYLGNRLTSVLFYLFSKKKIIDTQTGLRGIPREKLLQLSQLKGEHYEYEINMLIYASKINMEMVQVPIKTLYFNHNEGSHYNSVVDSIKVFNRLVSGFLSEKIQ